jgi:hypothetical protein
LSKPFAFSFANIVFCFIDSNSAADGYEYQPLVSLSRTFLLEISNG